MLTLAIKMTQEEDDKKKQDTKDVNVNELNNKLRCFSLQQKEIDSWQRKLKEQ